MNFHQNQKDQAQTMSNETENNQGASSNQAAGQARPIDIPGGQAAGMQRPAMQPPRVPGGGFPGGQSSYGSSPYGQPAASSNPYAAAAPGAKAGVVADGRRLVIGEGITISGEIEACDVLIVEGTIEAALKGARVLEIAESGVFYGAVEIEEATIAGRFEGDLTVNGRLTIRASGSITGAIAYKELAVEAGATLDGKVTPLSAKGEKREGKPGQARTSGKQGGQRDSGAELPFADKTAASA
ncbi:conserved hypothetical protein [Micavibrio aeruginosavorus ARL-13]|uniref:Polymer-forming cytoskeletal protein n=2 Tax=Micavibrio aeruginosavorus TaxID=349221 RepID=G2KRW9_MICAA|nr:conserved hypothetical protein [Micavibrio aeruginosavorus ARL-13]